MNDTYFAIIIVIAALLLFLIFYIILIIISKIYKTIINIPEKYCPKCGGAIQSSKIKKCPYCKEEI